jgi:hypothetical protein
MNVISYISTTVCYQYIEKVFFLSFRFDKLLYVGVAEDKESQLSIMMALTRRFVTDLCNSSTAEFCTSNGNVL